MKILNVYYKKNQYKLTKSSKNYIDTTLLILLKENPDIIIEISSYTDNTGLPKANLLLSDKRAKGVTGYLIKKGIAKNRVKSKGYGEQHNIANNKTPEGREKIEEQNLKLSVH